MSIPEKNLLEKIFCARLITNILPLCTCTFILKKRRKEGKLMFGQWAQ